MEGDKSKMAKNPTVAYCRSEQHVQCHEQYRTYDGTPIDQLAASHCLFQSLPASYETSVFSTISVNLDPNIHESTLAII